MRHVEWSHPYRRPLKLLGDAVPLRIRANPRQHRAATFCLTASERLVFKVSPGAMASEMHEGAPTECSSLWPTHACEQMTTSFPARGHERYHLTIFGDMVWWVRRPHQSWQCRAAVEHPTKSPCLRLCCVTAVALFMVNVARVLCYLLPGSSLRNALSGGRCR